MTGVICRKIVTLVVASVAALAVGAPAVLAQSEYPSGVNLRKGMGQGATDAYGTFDLNSGQKQTLSSLKGDRIHRICITGSAINVMANGNVFAVDSGDCIDIESSSVEVENPAGGGEAAGTYESYPVGPRRRQQ